METSKNHKFIFINHREHRVHREEILKNYFRLKINDNIRKLLKTLFLKIISLKIRTCKYFSSKKVTFLEVAIK
jgi:hypothetical protein